MADDLITMDRLLDALNKVPGDMEPQELDKYQASIKSASAAVRAYADRDFALNSSGIATTRTFEYDDSGYVDIDDAMTVTGVVVVFGGATAPMALSTTQWQAKPFNAPVKDSILLYGSAYRAGSREMGFTWNLDRFEGPWGPPPTIDVTAVWGWPAIPEDVQQATVWTAAAFAEDARQVTSESIDSFSRSMAVIQPSAIPLRAKELLDEYRRLTV